MTRRDRRGVSLAALTGFAIVPAVLIGGVWQYADANVPAPTTTTTTTLPPEPVDELPTDLLSLRRHPLPLAEDEAQAKSDAAFAAKVGVLEADIDDESCVRIVDDVEIVAEFGTPSSVIPASNQKLFVAAVALDVLGPDYRFRTELLSPRPFNGEVTGDVYLIGGGDPVLRTDAVPDPLRYPSFNTTSLDALADRLVTLGVTRIYGDIVGDGSRYDDEFRAPSWGDDITNVDGGPYDALLVNDGLVENGNYGLNPSRSAARAFADLLAARGIAVDGAAANRTLPADEVFTTLAFVESLPLTDVLVELLHTSDNNTAEMLVKEIGYVAAGSGTREAGLETMRATLAGWELPLDGVDFHDGSGLSRSNRATCAALAALLSATPVADELGALLPVAGRDGTLKDQMLGTEAEGQLRAKTGTLTDVKALSGTQPGSDRRDVDFSLVLNGPSANDPATYDPIWRRLISLISEYPIVIEPEPERFDPLTAAEAAGQE